MSAIAPGTLRIYPAFPLKNFGTGEVVTGEVVLHDAQPELIGRIAIELTGRTKTKIIRRNGNSRVTYRGRHQLFSTASMVHSESTPLEAGITYRWPFSISFPT